MVSRAWRATAIVAVALVMVFAVLFLLHYGGFLSVGLDAGGAANKTVHDAPGAAGGSAPPLRRRLARYEDLGGSQDAVLQLRVLDRLSGRPVCGATCVVDTRSEALAPLAEVTDAEGRADLGGLSLGVTVDLRVSAAGYQDATRELEISELHQAVAISLVGQVSLHGLVTDTQNRPLQLVGCSVRLGRHGAILFLTNTDAQGHYQFTGLPAAPEATVRFVKQGYGDVNRPVSLEVDQQLDARLDRTATLRVTIQFLEIMDTPRHYGSLDAYLVCGGEVFYQGPVKMQQGLAFVAADYHGGDRVQGAIAGPDLALCGGTIDVDALVEAVSPEGDYTALVLLDDIVEWHLRFVASSGEAVRFGLVNYALGDVCDAVSPDENGEVALLVSRTSSARGSIVFWSKHGVSRPLDLGQLGIPGDGQVTTVVLGEGGGELALRGVDRSTSETLSLEEVPWGDRPFAKRLEEGENGSLLVFSVPAGVYRLRWAHTLLDAAEYTVAAGDRLEVDFSGFQRDGRIAGSAPLAREIVLFRFDDQRPRDLATVRPDGEGRFVFERLMSGHYTVEARFGDGCRVWREVDLAPRARAEVGKLDSSQAVRLRIRFVDEKGQPVAGEKVWLQESLSVSHPGVHGGVTDDRGIWEAPVSSKGSEFCIGTDAGCWVVNEDRARDEITITMPRDEGSTELVLPDGDGYASQVFWMDRRTDHPWLRLLSPMTPRTFAMPRVPGRQWFMAVIHRRNVYLSGVVDEQAGRLVLTMPPMGKIDASLLPDGVTDVEITCERLGGVDISGLSWSHRQAVSAGAIGVAYLPDSVMSVRFLERGRFLGGLKVDGRGIVLPADR